MGYLRLDPSVSAINLPLKETKWHSDVRGSFADCDAEFCVSRKGCCTSPTINLPASVVNNVAVVDIPIETFSSFSRGYYTGTLTIGCEKVCDINFMVGQSLCTEPELVTDSDRGFSACFTSRTLSSCGGCGCSVTPTVIEGCHGNAAFCEKCSTQEENTVQVLDYTVVSDDGRNLVLRASVTCVPRPDPCIEVR